jgi:hypothetical protein
LPQGSLHATKVTTATTQAERTRYHRRMQRRRQPIARAGAFVMTFGALVTLAHAQPIALTKTARARRLIVVVTDDWTATRGELLRYTRGDRGTPWRQRGRVVPVVVGQTGLGWGVGLVPRPRGPELDGPDKQEGDGRAPAGLFALGEVTGDDAAAPAGTTLRYRHATPALRCVDDPAAPDAYNRLVDAPKSGAPPWASDERMRRADGLYRFTVFVRHNDARTPGRGSCVLLHVWRGADVPTVGCTAMALPALRTLIGWAEPTTLLVQLPRPVYQRLARDWDLPELPQRK